MTYYEQRRHSPKETQEALLVLGLIGLALLALDKEKTNKTARPRAASVPAQPQSLGDGHTTRYAPGTYVPKPGTRIVDAA